GHVDRFGDRFRLHLPGIDDPLGGMRVEMDPCTPVDRRSHRVSHRVLDPKEQKTEGKTAFLRLERNRPCLGGPGMGGSKGNRMRFGKTTAAYISSRSNRRLQRKTPPIAAMSCNWRPICGLLRFDSANPSKAGKSVIPTGRPSVFIGIIK